VSAPRDVTSGIIGPLIAWCARHPAFVIACALGLAAVGIQQARHLPLDALPELADTQVLIATTWNGHSPDLIEDQVTTPLCAALVSAPQVIRVRGQSFPDQSLITVVFAEGTDPYWARSRVVEGLTGIAARLPAGVTPTLGPDATSAGWVFQYALIDRSGRHDLSDLSALQEFTLRYALGSVPGVAEVATIGGALRQYQVIVDPLRLAEYHLPLSLVAGAVRHGNDDVGGRVIETAGHEQIIRGRGRITTAADLERIPLAIGSGGVPVLVKDVARVVVGRDDSRSIAELDGDGEVVGGVVVMRYGQNALSVIAGIKQRLAELRATLPTGVVVVTTYDRTPLIIGALDSMRRVLIEEMTMVALVILLFVLHLRSALIPLLAMPIALLAAIIPMHMQGLGANILSLSGIAMAVGVMVDASIIMIDNVHYRVARSANGSDRTALVIAALQEVGPTIVFALLVIAVSFLPVFTLEGMEGRLFRPLAWTKTSCMAWSAILAVTLIPALTVLLLRGRLRGEGDNPIMHLLTWIYLPVARLAVRRPKQVIAGALLALAASLPVISVLECEFMPPLNEGTILYMPASPPGISPTAALGILQRMDHELRSFPEVASVFGKMGSASTATDPAPLNMAETVVMLKPRSLWRPGLTWDGLLAEMDAKLRYPGMPNLWWMPIQTRTEMLTTGIRSPLGIALHGGNAKGLEASAIAIEQALSSDPRTSPYTRSVVAERHNGGFFCEIAIKRAVASRYGLNTDDLNLVIESAIGGAALGEVINGRERFPIALRYERTFREDPQALARLPVIAPNGAQVPLGEVADISFTTGSIEIASDGCEPLALVDADVQGIGIPDYVDLARRVVADAVVLGSGVHIEWVGQYRYFLRALTRLEVIIPITVAIIVLLLYLNTGSLVQTAMVLFAIPFSLIGAFWLLWLLHMKLSVAVAVGLIALAGIDAETGVVMLLYLQLSWRQAQAEGRLVQPSGRDEAILEGAARRRRPKAMTALCLIGGLLPAMWGDDSGGEVMKRIAAPMLGGIITSVIGELTVYPALFTLWMSRQQPSLGVK